MSAFTRRPITLLRPERRRDIERPFAWLPCRLLTEGWLAKLTAPAKLLYLFLCIASDRRGLSWYGDARISTILRLSPPELAAAQTELINLDLVEFDGRVYQVLSLPPPIQRSADPDAPEQLDPTEPPRTSMPAHVRTTLRHLFDLD
jgi:hypothetical protein